MEQTALRIGLLASSPAAEQMEALLDGPLTPDKSMIRCHGEFMHLYIG